MQAGAPRHISSLRQPFHSRFTITGSDTIVAQYCEDSRLPHSHVLAPCLFQADQEHSSAFIRPWRGEQKAGLSEVGCKRKIHITILGCSRERLLKEPDGVRGSPEFG